MTDLVAEKQAAARAAADLVRDGMRVGLGTGTTVAELIPALAERHRSITCVATSPATEELARAHGLVVVPFVELDRLDLTIDGADQVDPQSLARQGRRRCPHPRAHRGGGRRPFRRHRLVGQAGAAVAPACPARALGLRAVLDAAHARAHRRARRAADARWRGPGRLRRRVRRPGDRGRLADAMPGVVSHGLFPPRWSAPCWWPAANRSRRCPRRETGDRAGLSSPRVKVHRQRGGRAEDVAPDVGVLARDPGQVRQPVEHAIHQDPGLQPGQVHARGTCGDRGRRRCGESPGGRCRRTPGRPIGSRRGWPSRCGS